MLFAIRRLLRDREGVRALRVPSWYLGTKFALAMGDLRAGSGP